MTAIYEDISGIVFTRSKWFTEIRFQICLVVTKHCFFTVSPLMHTPYCSDISYHKVTEFPELLWDTEQRLKTRDMNADVALLASPPLLHVLQTCKREPCRLPFFTLDEYVPSPLCSGAQKVFFFMYLSSRSTTAVFISLVAEAMWPRTTAVELITLKM